MTLSSIFVWILCGLVVGLIARFLLPGRQMMSLPMTVMVGIAGAIVGGLLYSLVRGGAAQPFSLSGNAWYGWIVSILGAMFLLWLCPFVFPRKWWI